VGEKYNFVMPKFKVREITTGVIICSIISRVMKCIKQVMVGQMERSSAAVWPEAVLLALKLRSVLLVITSLD